MSAGPRSFLDGPLPGLHRPATADERASIDKYLQLLRKWQKTHRLVGSVEPAWLIENVVLDSLCFLDALPPRARSVADLGSGAGIPGIPIAIVRPDLEVVLIEARARRVSFLSTVVRELSLSRVAVVGSRAEALGPEYDRRFDAVLMRCAGGIEDVLVTARRLVAEHGVVIAAAPPASPPAPGGEALTVMSPSGTPRTLHRYPDA